MHTYAFPSVADDSHERGLIHVVRQRRVGDTSSIDYFAADVKRLIVYAFLSFHRNEIEAT